MSLTEFASPPPSRQPRKSGTPAAYWICTRAEGVFRAMLSPFKSEGTKAKLCSPLPICGHKEPQILSCCMPQKLELDHLPDSLSHFDKSENNPPQLTAEIGNHTHWNHLPGILTVDKIIECLAKNSINAMNDNLKKELALALSMLGEVLLGKKIYSELELCSLLLPPTYQYILKSDLCKLQAKAERGDKIDEVLTSHKYMGSQDAKLAIAAGLALAPNISLYSAEPLIAAVHLSTFMELGITPTSDQIAKTSPLAATLRDAIHDLAARVIAKKGEAAQVANHKFLATDKGPTSNKAIRHFVKLISFYDWRNQMTEFFLLDMDGTGNSSREAAEAVEFSLKEKELGGLIQFSGQTTDSGGGGTFEFFYVNLRDKGLVTNDFYFVANCTLHSLQLIMVGPTEKVFGLGGREKKNYMQLLHCMYDIEKHIGRDVWIDIFWYTLQEDS